jgi:hypothetical protein
MRFGIREVCDMHFTKLSGKGPASFVIESAKTSTLESASTTVYAQGGKGNSRLMAWEGEKTLTFTVEDALITMESFAALTGADVSDTANGIKFTSTTTSFAGYYSITADTLFRDEEGNDHPAYITIPRAKLQSNLNLAMSPSGDPSTFTFTFDAFPGTTNETKDTLFTLEVYDLTSESVEYVGDNVTTIILDGEAYSVTGTDPKFEISTAGVITLKTTTPKADSKTITPVYKTGDAGLTDLVNYYAKGTATSAAVSLTKGTTTRFYVI